MKPTKKQIQEFKELVRKEVNQMLNDNDVLMFEMAFYDDSSAVFKVIYVDTGYKPEPVRVNKVCVSIQRHGDIERQVLIAYRIKDDIDQALDCYADIDL